MAVKSLEGIEDFNKNEHKIIYGNIHKIRIGF